MKKLNIILVASFAVILLTGYSFAQDAVKVDPKHYKVEFENDEVRVLRITYGPGEKSVMHSHSEGVAIFMTDGEGKFTFPDGKTKDIKFKSGDVVWSPETSHQPENTGKKSYEVIQIELKKK
jgi:quercetin dioxygenase-like cupin family protein